MGLEKRVGIRAAAITAVALVGWLQGVAQAQGLWGGGGSSWPTATPYSLAVAGGTGHWGADCSRALDCDRNANTLRVTGGWQFAPQAAVEVFYVDEGEVKARGWTATEMPLMQTTRLRVRGGGVGVAWWMPFDENWKGVARLGGVVHRVRLDENTDVAADSTLVPSSDTRDEFDPTVGLGVSYRISPQWQVDGRLDWTNTRLRPSASSLLGGGTRGAHQWSLGLTYGF